MKIIKLLKFMEIKNVKNELLAVMAQKIIFTLQISEPKPKIVDALLGEEVVDVACSDRHVIALTSDNQTPIYTWGKNTSGCLGIKISYLCV